MEREEEASLSPAQLLQLAESHLRLRNFSLCREYALESQQPEDPHRHHSQLYAAQLVAVADILSAAASPGVTNWYSVLQVDTFSDDLNLIRSQFKKLLRLLEPINGKFAMAGEALNLVSKAYGTLSNPAHKTQLDSQLALLLSNQKHFNGDEGGEGSFWTFCPYCFYVYQYAKVYEGCCLRCQNETCRRAFHGVSLCSLPKMELDKGQYFGCFGYFPMGFSPSEGEAKAKFDSWSPIVGLFPVKRVRKTCAGRIDLDGDYNDNDNNDNVHCVEILDDSDESEAPQHENENEHMEMNMEGPNSGLDGGKPRMKKKTVAWNAKKLMGRGRSNEGPNDSRGRSEYVHADETYGFEGLHDVGMASGCGLDADDVKFFEEDGEIFVGLGPDDAL